MKIFNKTEDFQTKVNFVDDNNMLLGWDTAQHCCETADWFIADRPLDGLPKDTEPTLQGLLDLPGWNFDRTYRKSVNNIADFDEGGMTIFRITNGPDEKFLHLYNSHNGYYSHGFEFKSGDVVIDEGSL